MKKILLLVALLFSNFLYSQFIPTLEEDNEWSVAYSDYWSGGITNINKFTFFGEEVINGKTYKKLYNDGELSPCRLREENGIIYSYDANINNEKIMIDLNLEIGENVYEDYFCFGGGGGTIWEYRVVDINIEFIAGENRKVITIEGFDSDGQPFDYFEYWIEGIGSTKGLAPFGYNWDFDNLLTCFTKNGETTYFNGFTQCNPPLAINDFNENKIILYPNPVTDKSILQFSDDSPVDMIKVFYITGKLINEQTISEGHYFIDAIQYPSGLYFYQVFTENKLIKVDKFLVK